MEEFVNRSPRSLIEKIRDFFLNFVDEIRAIAERYANRAGSERQEIKALLGMSDELTDIARFFDAALETASMGQENATNPQNEHANDADSGDGVKFSRTMSFVEQLKKLRDGLFPRNDHLYVMDTPEVLQRVGFRNLPILVTQDHAKSVMKVSGSDSGANYHGLTITMMGQLPNAIANPVMIIKSHDYTNRVTVITSLKNDAGETVIVPIKMDGRGVLNGKHITANIMTTAYGKHGLKGMLLTAVMSDEVMYADKKRSDALAVNVGVQFPKIVRNGGFIHSISDFASDVNNKMQAEENSNAKTSFSLQDELTEAQTRRIESNQPVSGEVEAKWSLARNEEFMDNARNINAKTGNVDQAQLNNFAQMS